MKCRHCHAEWHGQSEKTLTFCPSCGRQLKDGKEPFHIVWASIEEENLKRKPGQAAFDAAASHYLQAVQENPAWLYRLTQFLADWPQLASHSAILQPLLSQKQNNQDAKISFEDAVLLNEAAKGKQPSLTMAFHEYCNLLQSRQGADRERMQFYEKMLLEAADETSDTLGRAATAAMKKDWTQSMQLLKEALLENSEEALSVSDELAIQYAGLHQNAQERISDIRNAIKQPDSAQQAARIADLLVRPLLKSAPTEEQHGKNTKQDGRDAFDHLPLIDNEILEWIIKNWPHVKEVLNQYVSNRKCLRGVHLALNEIKSRIPELEPECSALLDDHFVEVFMQDYDTIAATDRIW